MSDGYEVVLSEVLNASRVFGRQAEVLTELRLPGGMRDTASACLPGTLPEGGDPTLDSAIADVLQAAGMTTGQLAAVIRGHATKLQACYDKYHATEESNAQLFDQLLNLLGNGK